MKPVNCWIYFDYYIWLLPDGSYQVEGVRQPFRTLQEAQRHIDTLRK